MNEIKREVLRKKGRQEDRKKENEGMKEKVIKERSKEERMQ
jgi:hypothetical protein